MVIVFQISKFYYSTVNVLSHFFLNLFFIFLIIEKFP